MEDTGGIVTETRETMSATQPRAYQLELFGESMKRNVIVTMDTGSGKTQIFVRMGRIALLVFDEAHHCMGSHDTNRIMQEFYHIGSPTGTVAARPFILGLSASPITNAKPGALENLEHNLDAICRAPTRHLEELQRFVHQPQMRRLVYRDDPVPPSEALQELDLLEMNFDIEKDPYVKYLQRDESPQSQRQLEKVRESGSTESRKQLKTLLRRTTEIHQQIGNWASAYFLQSCAQNVRKKVERCSNMLLSLEMEEEIFLYQHLSSIVRNEDIARDYVTEDFDISPKAVSLLKYLEAEFTEHVRGIIFVKERSTAAILAHLISHHPLTRNYNAAPFVGSSSFARKQSPVDLSDIKNQNIALADFRLGKNNLLVCTSVMEEGVDISSMNLVIRFDEPANFRAFIQSRGRARKVESKFVLMCSEYDPVGSYQKWKALEAEMKEKYMDDVRQIAHRVEDEKMDEEAYDEHLANDITGARLSIEDAKGHLEHFCACLPTVPYADPPRPEYILRCCPAGHFQADVILPHSVNIMPRRIGGRFVWATQKMATKDAALQAYTRLYEAGLINNNLLPTALPDPVVPIPEAELDEEDRVVCVRGRINPWSHFPERRNSPGQQVLTISVQFSGGEQLPCLHLLVREVFDITMAFTLFWSNEQSINVEIRPERLTEDVLHDQEFQRISHLSTRRLFESIYLGKMQRQSKMPQTFPFLVVPYLEARLLYQWLDDCTGDAPIQNADELRPENGLIRLKSWPKEAHPYMYRSSMVKIREFQWIDDSTRVADPTTEELHFEVKRLPKRLDYLRPANYKDFNTAVDVVPAAECYIDRFPPTYAMSMLLLPSVLHRFELRAVAVALSRNVLSSIRFQNFELLENAICASAANESINYQRLELIGDTILKFWTSAQLCAQFPGWHEGYLSRGKDRVVSNAHLCRAAKSQGLDEYIHTEPFAGSRWRPPTQELKVHDAAITSRRKISRKVLADVVEALIGASFLDGKDEQERGFKVKACLTTFLASISWRSTKENATMLNDSVPNAGAAFDNFNSLEEITGYAFQKLVLLVEAFTHPSHPPVGIQGSYQRLEFLGDSILDFIVVDMVARHSKELPHFTMHLIRAAVVNAHLLAFLCLRAGLDHARTEVTTDASSGSFEIREIKKKTYLWEFMKHSGNLELLEAQKACAKRYEQFNCAIDTALDYGKSHPWYYLLSLNAEKFFSDLIESILGAIFIDSKGNLQPCREFLERIGLLRYLRRIIAEEFDIMHPKERLGIVAGNSKVRYVTVSKIVDAAAHYSCTVFVDDESTATSTGEVCKAAAETRAAQDAVALILKARCNSTGKGKDERNV
ncbi:hypothetical protein EPUS_04185 [Endocarpon pusillum Z07020]|uniref:Dicer-like protein 2 n=1 Tax=Endocarpon pusillum (strain Z07020 / HMAS-L-300199) TaxID=1263415 RepID=U1GFB2_ENDPU|nr:uncharacterized protein EPUS_04185 [Endocarpon pusillum Z07020]ERF76327.1 hypothetical protein EPUS_04185 [Endocarpon pusillum Z07020]